MHRQTVCDLGVCACVSDSSTLVVDFGQVRRDISVFVFVDFCDLFVYPQIVFGLCSSVHDFWIVFWYFWIAVCFDVVIVGSNWIK